MAFINMRSAFDEGATVDRNLEFLRGNSTTGSAAAGLDATADRNAEYLIGYTSASLRHRPGLHVLPAYKESAEKSAPVETASAFSCRIPPAPLEVGRNDERFAACRLRKWRQQQAIAFYHGCIHLLYLSVGSLLGIAFYLTTLFYGSLQGWFVYLSFAGLFLAAWSLRRWVRIARAICPLIGGILLMPMLILLLGMQNGPQIMDAWAGLTFIVLVGLLLTSAGMQTPPDTGFATINGTNEATE